MASASVAATAQGATLPPEAKTAAHGWLAEVRRVHTLADGATTETEKRSALSEMTRVFDASTEISRKLEAPARVGVPSSGALGAGAKTSPSSASEVTLLSQDLASRAARIELGLGNGPAALAWAERGLALSKAPSVLRANLLLDAADAHKLSGKPALASPYLLEALRINQGLLDEELAKP